MFGNAKIIEALATIKADTKNHNGELKEFKNAFNKHLEKEEKRSAETDEKMEAIKCSLQNFDCPHNDKILKLERRFHDSQKIHDNRRATDREDRAKEKALEVKERATKDEETAKEISSLKTSRKYQWLTSSGIYIILGVILKKVFTH